jgi:hypothetical protein
VVCALPSDTRNPRSTATLWVKVAAQWFTLALYTWTLVAPKLFPDRAFY